MRFRKNYRAPALLGFLSLFTACSVEIGNGNSGTQPSTTAPENPVGVSQTEMTSPTRVLPQTLEAMAEFVKAPKPLTVTDTETGTDLTVLGASLGHTVFNPKLSDQLDLGSATRYAFVSPLPGKCVEIRFTQPTPGPGFTSALMISGREKSGQTDCRDFLAKVASEGAVIRYEGVPTLNSNGDRIPLVTLRLSLP